MKRLVLLGTLVALCSLGLPGLALAASPGNDEYSGRTVVAAFPFSDEVDTTEATTDALDASVNLECGAPATDASVWYEYTPGVDGQFVVDTSGSNYSVGIIVLTGAEGSFLFNACGPDGLVVYGTAGETLTILVFDYDEVGNGGNLSLAITEVPPPPVLELTVSRQGSVNQRTGLATITGTISCSGGDESGKNYLDVQLTQRIGRFVISAGGSASFACDGQTEPWTVEVTGYNGRLAGGKATVTVFATACTFNCTTVTADQTITLRR